ncbi:MAG: cupredoxin domain-containing protein [Patescibacteria group bacterium]
MNKNLIILSVIIAAVIGVYYFASGTKPGIQNNTLAGNTAAVDNSIQQNQTMFSIDAKRWQFTPDVISVKKGQKVKIIINNSDTTHGINVPDFNVSGNDSVEFIADKTGEFSFICNTYCGNGHAIMTGKIVVTE